MSGAVRKTNLPVSRLVGAVSNCAYAVRLDEDKKNNSVKFAIDTSAVENRAYTYVSRKIEMVQMTTFNEPMY